MVQAGPEQQLIDLPIPPTTAADLRKMTASFSEEQRSMAAWMSAKMPEFMLAHVLAECEHAARTSGFNELEFKLWIDSIVDLLCNAAFHMGFKDRKDVRQSCIHHFAEAIETLVIRLASKGFQIDFKNETESQTGDYRLWLKVSW